MAENHILNDSSGNPPVIADPADPAGGAALTTYIRHQINTPLADITNTEADRLSDYFSALEKRMRRPQAAPVPQQRSVWTWFRKPASHPPEQPSSLSTPGTMRRIFMRSTEETKNTILSRVAVIPNALLESSALKDLHAAQDIKSEIFPTPYGDTLFNLGFIQTIKKGPPANVYYNAVFNDKPILQTKSTTSFPVFALDTAMMSAIHPHGPQAMLEALQAMANIVNHDSTHQLIKVDPQDKIVSNLTYSETMAEMSDTLRSFTGSFQETHPLGYESAAIISHAKTLRETSAFTELGTAVDKYFDELERISAAMQKDLSVSPEESHKTIDYFSTAAGFLLMRVMPLNAPLMQRALARMEKADPSPEAVQGLPPPDEKYILKIIKSYEPDGHSMLDPSGRALSYSAAKEMQLVDMLPGLALLFAPAAPDSQVAAAHNRIDTLDAALLGILAKPVSPQ